MSSRNARRLSSDSGVGRSHQSRDRFTRLKTPELTRENPFSIESMMLMIPPLRVTCLTAPENTDAGSDLAPRPNQAEQVDGLADAANVARAGLLPVEVRLGRLGDGRGRHQLVAPRRPEDARGDVDHGAEEVALACDCDAVVEARVDARAVVVLVAADDPPGRVDRVERLRERQQVAVAEPLDDPAVAPDLLGHRQREALDRLDGGLVALAVGVGGEVLQVAEEDGDLDGARQRDAARSRLRLADRHLRELALEQPPVEGDEG